MYLSMLTLQNSRSLHYTFFIRTLLIFGLHERPNLSMHHLLDHIFQDIKRRQSKENDSTVYKLNTGAKEIQQVNCSGPDNSQSIRSLPSHQIDKSLYPLQTLFVGGILFSRCPSVRPSVRNALFP